VTAQPLTIAEVLTRAADLIEPEGAWLQGEMAEDADGFEVSAGEPTAVCWCIAGAIRRVSSANPGLYGLARNLLLDHIGESLVTWNDAPERTQAEVVAALRAAAEKARRS